MNGYTLTVHTDGAYERLGNTVVWHISRKYREITARGIGQGLSQKVIADSPGYHSFTANRVAIRP